MAYLGMWGTFIHIPKCAGMSMLEYLRCSFTAYTIENGTHGLPSSIKSKNGITWAIVRHPADWLPSFYAYYRENSWKWEALPQYVDDQFSFAKGLDWTQFIASVTSDNPGTVGKVFDYYCVPGVKVYKIENLSDYFPGIRRKHTTNGKPKVTLEQRQMICKAEQDTLERYGYNDK